MFTVPTGRVYVVRNIQLVFFSWTASVAARLMGPGTTTAAWLWRQTITQDQTVWLETRLVFDAGETLYAVRTTGVGMTVTVNGYDFAA